MMETASNVFALKDIPDGRADKASKDTISALKKYLHKFGMGTCMKLDPTLSK